MAVELVVVAVAVVVAELVVKLAVYSKAAKVVVGKTKLVIAAAPTDSQTAKLVL